MSEKVSGGDSEATSRPRASLAAAFGTQNGRLLAGINTKVPISTAQTLAAAFAAQNGPLLAGINTKVPISTAQTLAAAFAAQNGPLLAGINTKVPISTAQTLAAAFAAYHPQLQAALGRVSGRTTARMLLKSPQSLQAATVDAALENLERAVEQADRHTGTEIQLLGIWLESMRNLGTWLRQPGVAWPSVALIWLVVSYWWVTLKSQHPDVADMVEVPFSSLAGAVLGAAIAATIKKQK
ncbi:hypothetical protein OG400_09705 [Micromonospora ureilytica]|uniref:hypothetical protein n=1 Tax=Micromonospora ureilytica TaxID=709868 RepID=UPI002E118A33|nr:hypothetical protein OG400_09705 [Micromonospora ureilytica]